MLVISRKLNEKILIGANIWLTIVDLKKKRVRIGFEADPSIAIYRSELLEAIARQESEAADEIPPWIED